MITTFPRSLRNTILKLNIYISITLRQYVIGNIFLVNIVFLKERGRL